MSGPDAGRGRSATPAAASAARWCPYCGAPLPSGPATCPACDDLPALDLTGQLFPRRPVSSTCDRLAGSRQLAERLVILSRVVEPPNGRPFSLAAGCLLALALGALLWVGIYWLLRLLGV